MSNNKKKNIHVLIQECTEHLRFLGYSEACITLHQKKWSEYLLPYLQEKDIVFYSTETGECYLKSVRSNLTPFSKRVLTRSVHILSAYLDTGIIPKRIVPIEEHPLPGEIGEAAHLFLEELVNSRRNDITVLKHRRNLSYFIEFLGPVGKRDYAILLLATRLGLRASDICRLEFDHLDWDHNVIAFIQYKTKKSIELPLLTDVGEAIVNYLRYGRPISGHSEIFLSARPPYRPMFRWGINGVISRIMRESGVDISKRKFGPHAMRHSLASRLLANGVSLPVISESLGHESSLSTMEYLRVDLSSLMKCALDVPPVNSAFYEQKGGIFYGKM